MCWNLKTAKLRTKIGPLYTKSETVFDSDIAVLKYVDSLMAW